MTAEDRHEANPAQKYSNAFARKADQQLRVFKGKAGVDSAQKVHPRLKR